MGETLDAVIVLSWLAAAMFMVAHVALRLLGEVSPMHWTWWVAMGFLLASSVSILIDNRW